MIAPEVGAAALGPLESAPRDEPRGRHLVLEVQPVLPGKIEGRAVRHGRGWCPLPDFLDLPERGLEAGGMPDQAHVLPHHLAQPVLKRVEILPFPPPERRGEELGSSFGGGAGEPRHRVAYDPVGHRVTGDAAEYGGVSHAVAAQAVRAVDAARILSRDEEPLYGRPARRIDDDAA